MVSWSNLHEQFGDGYASVKKFKQNFLHALWQAMASIRPPVSTRCGAEACALLPSPPPIAVKAWW